MSDPSGSRHKPGKSGRYGIFASLCDGVPTLAPDPYVHELYGNDTPVWLCQCERAERAADV